MTTTARRWGSVPAITAALLLSACGTPAPPSATPQAEQHSPAAEQAAPGTVPITVEVVNGQVQGPTDRVELARGQHVRLTVRSDKSDELHVHGYDKSAELRPNEPATIDFTADIPGVFEVELHHSELSLPSLLVR